MTDVVIDVARVREDLAHCLRNLQPRETLNLLQNMCAVWLSHFEDVIARLRDGEHVPKARLADLIRYCETLPPDVRRYIAGRLDGSIKPRGRPTPEYDPEYQTARAVRAVCAIMVRKKRDEYRAQGMRAGTPGGEDPYRAALRFVSQDTGIPEETLDKYAYPRGNHRKRAP